MAERISSVRYPTNNTQQKLPGYPNTKHWSFPPETYALQEVPSCCSQPLGIRKGPIDCSVCCAGTTSSYRRFVRQVYLTNFISTQRLRIPYIPLLLATLLGTHNYCTDSTAAITGTGIERLGADLQEKVYKTTQELQQSTSLLAGLRICWTGVCTDTGECEVFESVQRGVAALGEYKR